MGKFVTIVLAGAFAVVMANAQTKVAGKAACSKPEPSYSIEVGDRPGHSLMLQKATCKWTAPLSIEGLHSKDGFDVTSSDAIGSTMTERGYHISTMDNGDKFTVQYQGTIKAAKEGAATFDGKWAFINGTGKLKGIKGGGTYKGTGTPDGSGNIEVEGSYSFGAAKSSQ